MAQRILAVDDDEAILRLVALTLKREGFDVMTTSEPANVTPAALVYRPDLIVCDVMMPNVDGFEVLRRLQEHPLTNHIPVVFLSAGRGEDVKTRAFRSGVVDYITKPFTSQALVLNLRRALLGVSRGSGSVTKNLESTPTEEFLNKLTEGLRSGVMSIRADAADGAVVLKAGEIIASFFGELRGDAALTQMYAQRGGELHFREADGTKVALFDGKIDQVHDPELIARIPAGSLGGLDNAPPRRLLLFGQAGHLQESLKHAFTQDGFEVFVSQITAVGIEFAKRAQPEIVLCDVLAPDLSGVDFLEAVREEGALKDVPILMVAASDPAPLTAAAMEATGMLAAGRGLGDRLDAFNALRGRLSLLLERRQQQAASGEGERPVGLHGDLRFVQLGELATLMETGEKSGWVMVVSGDETAAFYFTRGYLVHAELNEEIAGEPGRALEAARDWADGEFEYFPD